MIKDFKIKSLKLHEFLGATGEMDLKFNPKVTEFIGDNGKGKSLILNSIAFLLTGKDAFGNTRTFFSNDGHKEAFTFVEAECIIGGEETTLKRLVQRNSTGRTSTTLWKDHGEVKADDWKANFDSDIVLSIINPKYLSSLKSKDLKKVLLKLLNQKEIDVPVLMYEIFDEVEGDDFDEFTEIIELFDELKDVDEVFGHIEKELKTVKDAIKEKKAAIKAFEESPIIPAAPFKFKIDSKYYFSESDAYNAVEAELITSPGTTESLALFRRFVSEMQKYALQNKNHLDYEEAEKQNLVNHASLNDYKKDEALLSRQMGYMEKLNQKIIEAMNLEYLKEKNLSFEFTDIFSKDNFSISYKGNPIADCSYAEQVTASIYLADYLMTYLGLDYPMFIDNAECITSFPKLDNERQLISMQVAEGYELSYYNESDIVEVKTLKTMPKVDKKDLVKTRIIGASFELSE